MRKSAGILPYRRTGGRLEVMLVHPGGPFWAQKDDGAWSIAKGEFADDESPEAAARREFTEETSFEVTGALIPLEPIRQSGGKHVFPFAVEQEFDAAKVVSNTFPLEWPPRSGRFVDTPEVDRAAWFSLEEARRKIFKSQLPILDDLERAERG